MTVEMIVHHFRDVLSAVVTQYCVTTRTYDFVAAVFLQNTDLAFAACSDQSFRSSLFDHTSFRDPVLFLGLCAGKWYVGLELAKPARHFSTLGIIAPELAVLFNWWTYSGKIAERAGRKIR